MGKMDSSSVARYLRLEVHFPQEGFIVGLGVQYIREEGHVKMVRLEFAPIERFLEQIQYRTFETSVSLIVYQMLMVPFPFFAAISFCICRTSLSSILYP
jgi:hypothetical protein